MEPEILAYYDLGAEAERLAAGAGVLELLRTQDILRRVLPSPPGRVLDVGGGTGVYAGWLAGLGYEVLVVDPVPGHVTAAGRLAGVSAVLGDARALAEPDASADTVLLLGPLYHLVARPDRVAALAQARRVLRPGGVVVAAAISRFASMHDGWANSRITDPAFERIVYTDLATGVHRNPGGDSRYFTTAYFHRPEELAAELTDAGLAVGSILSVEGVAGWLADRVGAWLADPDTRQRVLGPLRAVEAEPSLLGASSHILAVGYSLAS